jgi:membrane fusion protein, multidrug efflux system
MLVIAGVAWWIHTRPAPQAPTGRFSGSGPTPVVASAAEKGDIKIILNALGTVTPLATVTVKSQISGQLVRIAFEEGQMVKAGDLLAEIDSRPYERQRDQAQGQLVRDQALLKDAQIDFARYKKLLSEDSIAKQQVDTQEYLVHQFEGTVQSDQAMVDTANLNIAYCHVIAPVTGRVGLRQVDQGNYVQANDANGLVVLTQVQPITVVFTLPEDNLPAVLKQLHAGVAMEVTAWDRSMITKLATGKLNTTDNQIDTTTGTVKLRAQFANQDESMFPNQFVNVQLLVDTLHDATVILSPAIQRGAPGTFVYLVKSDDTVAVQPIKLGPAEGDRVSVLSGLSPGDRVVVDGADRLRDGAKVTTSAGAAPTGAASPGTAQPQGQQRRRTNTPTQ